MILFPVNGPSSATAVRAAGVVASLALPDWGGAKLDRLREAGYEVVVPGEGAEKEVPGADVREALRNGGDWEPLVPPGVAALLKRLERVPV